MPSARSESALARSKGIENGDRVIIRSARGEVEVYALVTERFQPYFVALESTVHQIGIPWHWGWAGLGPGRRVQTCSQPTSADPNTFIPEYKVFLCDVEREHEKGERENA